MSSISDRLSSLFSFIILLLLGTVKSVFAFRKLSCELGIAEVERLNLLLILGANKENVEVISLLDSLDSSKSSDLETLRSFTL